MPRRSDTRKVPDQMGDISVIDKQWKCTDTNNGYLKSKSGAEESLLGSNAVTTVVQVSGGGTKTMVLPQTKPVKEKCLLATVLALIIFCGVLLLIIVINSKSQSCMGEYLLFYFN